MLATVNSVFSRHECHSRLKQRCFFSNGCRPQPHVGCELRVFLTRSEGGEGWRLGRGRGQAFAGGQRGQSRCRWGLGGGSEVWRGRRWFGLDSVFGMLVGLGSAVFVWICLSVGENKGDDEGL